MSVLTRLATCDVINSELTNCPRTTDNTGRVGDSMTANERVVQDTVSSKSLVNVIENIHRTRIDAGGNRLSLKDEQRLYPKSWSDSTSLAGFAREIAAWLGYVDPRHTDGRHTVDCCAGL